MKILVTGDKGFVGSETRKLLEKEGHEVIGYDLMEGWDIRDKEQIERSVIEPRFNGYNLKIDRILHLAAIARFSDADKDPNLAFETNVLGTKNVVDVAMKYHIPVVLASTGSCYMPVQQEDKMLTEESRAVGNSVYGCTKYVSETYVRKQNPHIILRYAHLLGAEKRYHGLIGGILSRVERGMAPIIFGGAQSNDFTYVKDIAEANLKALTAPWDAWNETYNIGTGEELTADEAAKIVCEVFNYKGDIEHKPMRTVDPLRFWFDVSKAKNRLGFSAKFSFREALLDMKHEVGYDTSNEVKSSTA